MKSASQKYLLGLLLSGFLSGFIASSALAQDEATGAGATFPAPLYAKWAADYYKATGVKINYQSVGSGAGLRQIEAKTVAFGASDEPLTDEDLAKKGLVQFPTVIGGIVPVINIKGIAEGQLKLTGALLADIYLGKITRWNDPAILAVNPGLALTDVEITVVRRADGSGTTFGFTNYLSKVSPTWKERVGQGKAVAWPVGTGGKGNEGVAAFVTRLPNSIGYVEYAYVKQNKLNYVLLQNSTGQFVRPSDQNFKAAAAGADWTKSFYQILTNQAGKEAWPITSATFILMQKVQEQAAQASAVLKFFDWAYRSGDKVADDLDYVPMPEAVEAIILKSWVNIKDSSGKAIVLK